MYDRNMMLKYKNYTIQLFYYKENFKCMTFKFPAFLFKNSVRPLALSVSVANNNSTFH